MPVQNLKYCEYFRVDENYFPCIDESAISAGVDWRATYPHQTFIDMLKKVEKMLGGSTGRSLWIHGAYGTGKSRCAYTLKELLDAPEEEVRAYWKRYEPLQKETLLLEKLLGFQKQGIVTAWRYASGAIDSPRQLFFAVQESIQRALEERGLPYRGEDTLKEGVISWLQDPAHSHFLDELLQRPKWRSTFSQSDSQEVISALRKSSDCSSLVANLLTLAAEEGITALDLSADSLKAWIRDVIQKNHVQIVLLWDEFSDYLIRNATSLGELQKIVALCQECPFYFVIVTHPQSSLSHYFSVGDKNSSWAVLQQRFEKVEISLPDNIAYRLIAHAINVDDAVKASWKQMVGDLGANVTGALAAVRKAAGLDSEEDLRNILPLHPVAAFVLKNIATAFQSNQRSMFDFIKTPKDDSTQAFQWFIRQASPLSDRPLLTVDMLWDFFYEKNRDSLTTDIRLILDTYPQQNKLNWREQAVLKTILIMSALDARLGGIYPLLKPSDQNLSYAFEGDEQELAYNCKNIAKALVSKGILIENPIGNNQKAYAPAVLAGDAIQIEKYKKEIREKTDTAKLIDAAPELGASLSLPPALKLRYALDMDSGRLPVVCVTNFKKTMDELKQKDVNWRFYAVLAVAKTEEEGLGFRGKIRELLANPEYKNLIVIDALSRPLGPDLFNNYVDYAAMSQYYSHNNGQQSRENDKRARDVLRHDWSELIHDGNFIVFTCASPEGEKAMGAEGVQAILQAMVRKRFPRVLDFTKGLTETQLKLTQGKSVARAGIAGEGPVKGLIAGCEKNVLGKFWGKAQYWQDGALAGENIVAIKRALDQLIETTLNQDGKVAIGDIYDVLETDFGFSPCNLSAFVTGFLLKEYSAEPYQAEDAMEHREPMTPDKLAEMIGNYIGKNPKPVYIVTLTPEERAFYELTERGWDVPAKNCGSPQLAGQLVQNRMRELGYPVWCLEDVDTTGAFELAKLYIRLVQEGGERSHNVANEIGAIAMQRPSSGENLRALLTKDNCREGMKRFLARFEGGKLLHLAEDIGAQNTVLGDVKQLFSIPSASIWLQSTGEEEIRKLIVQYEVTGATNRLLNGSEHSLAGALNKWRNVLHFIGFSCETIRKKRPELSDFFGLLLRIARREELLPEHVRALRDELSRHNEQIRELFDHPLSVFMELYARYLDGFSEAECEELRLGIGVELFTASEESADAAVKNKAEETRRGQRKTRLAKLWRDRTGTESPHAWSRTYRTPILCCIPSAQYAPAKQAFAAINSGTSEKDEVEAALRFLENVAFWDALASAEYRDSCFVQRLFGDYACLLSVEAVRDMLERSGIDAYEWSDSPVVREAIQRMAEAEYNPGGSERAERIIDDMTDEELKQWLKGIIRRDAGLGAKIINNARRKG